MARIALLAPTGMLGSMVYQVLHHQHQLVLVNRNAEKLALLNQAYGGVDQHQAVSFDFTDLLHDHIAGFPTDTISPNLKRLRDEIGDVDAIINCAGVIKPYSTKDPAVTLFINGSLPHLLSAVYGDKLIHITTDCAFHGLSDAPYTEESPKTANDLYGHSKAIGEPADRSLVLRTSIIGPEIHSFVSLIAWVQKQQGQTVKGFTNHLWNGITTKQFGLICDQIIQHRAEYPVHGLFHLFSSTVNKYDMVTALAKKYNITVTVEPATPNPVDRRLGTVHGLCAQLGIPSFYDMIADL